MTTSLLHDRTPPPERADEVSLARSMSRATVRREATPAHPVPAADDADDLAVLSHHGRSFRLAGRLLGHAQFVRATALYAACRAADDLADESPEPALARDALEAVHRDLAGKGGAPTALGARFRRLGVDPGTAALLVRTMLSDLEPVRTADQDALLDYAAGVAGTVGLMMCDVLGINDPVARRHASALGIAMQLTNIARDVREDAARDRLYLPADWLPSGTMPGNLADNPAGVFHAVQQLLMLAEQHYADGALGYPALPGRARLAIPVAAALYRRIGRQILRAGPGFLQRPRTVVPPLTRAALVASTVLAQLTKAPPRLPVSPCPGELTAASRMPFLESNEASSESPTPSG